MAAKRLPLRYTFCTPSPTLRLRRSRRRSGCRCRRRMPGRIGEEAEELRIRPQQETGIARLEPVLVGGHRAVEREKIRILAIGLGEQPVTLGIAGAPRLFSGRIGLGDDDGRLTIGL